MLYEMPISILYEMPFGYPFYRELGALDVVEDVQRAFHRGLVCCKQAFQRSEMGAFLNISLVLSCPFHHSFVDQRLMQCAFYI